MNINPALLFLVLLFPVSSLASHDPVIGGLHDSDVILSNETGLAVARFEIDGRTYDTLFPKGVNKALITVTPSKHNMSVTFVGGAEVKWPHFQFQGVHEIFFQRSQNHIEARFQ